MAKTEFYQIFEPRDQRDLIDQLNRILNQISDRMDRLEGIRGTTVFQDGITVQNSGEILHGINTENEDDANN